MSIWTANRKVLWSSILVVVGARTKWYLAKSTLKVEWWAFDYLISVRKSPRSFLASHFDSVTPSTRSASGEEFTCWVRAINDLLVCFILDCASWTAINNFKVRTLWSLAAWDDGSTAESLVTSHVPLVAVAWEASTSDLFITEWSHVIDVVSWDVATHALRANAFNASLGVLSENSEDNSRTGYCEDLKHSFSYIISLLLEI